MGHVMASLSITCNNSICRTRSPDMATVCVTDKALAPKTLLIDKFYESAFGVIALYTSTILHYTCFAKIIIALQYMGTRCNYNAMTSVVANTRVSTLINELTLNYCFLFDKLVCSE